MCTALAIITITKVRGVRRNLRGTPEPFAPRVAPAAASGAPTATTICTAFP
jgi:hypothetical protein